MKCKSTVILKPYLKLWNPLILRIDNGQNHKLLTRHNKYTPKQGQYLSFIYYYTKLNGYPPAEADMQKYFRTTPPTVHSMVLQLEKKNFIERTPRKSRSIKILLHRDEIPDLE
ncbi:MAG: MarR family transcriptional regulator [SAR324 cluster bacterium]|nr:MarR family transcriptional regulator [SAR324 cluster bacterium]